MGDPHGVKVPKSKIGKVDAVLITGDIGKADLARAYFFKKIKNYYYEPSKKEERDAFMEVHNSSMDVLKHYSDIAPVYFVFGNVEQHDFEVRKLAQRIGYKLPLFVEKVKKMNSVGIINNRFVNLGGFRVGGLEYFVDTSWVREFKPDDYSKKLKKARRESEKVKKVLNWFGNRIDVLLCHQPPYGVLDKVNFPGVPDNWKGKHAGSKVILDYLKKYQLKYVCCGHIHEGEGKARVGKTEVYNLGSSGNFRILDIK